MRRLSVVSHKLPKALEEIEIVVLVVDPGGPQLFVVFTGDTSSMPPLAMSQKQMDEWLRGALDGVIRNAEDALAKVTLNFRVKLLGASGYLLWGVFAGGILGGAGLLFLGYWFGKHI